MLFADGGVQPLGKIQPEIRKPVEVVAEPPREVAQATKMPTEIKPKHSSKSRKQRIIEMAKKIEAEDDTQDETTVGEQGKTSNRKKDILDEIARSKQEISPGNEKQKEQLEIIDQFIKTQPSISNKRDQPPVASQGDLSTIKAGEFNDNVVSETLVDLLIKQGKNDKAIEVLKKLIWKFPQKKAYFAAQIQELKK
jgi:predicted Zn-dependent protease